MAGRAYDVARAKGFSERFLASEGAHDIDTPVRLMAAGLVLASAAGCGSAQTSPGSSVPTSKASATPTPITAASAPVVCGGRDTCRFEDEVLAFGYPASWHAASYDVVSSFSTDLVYLSTAAMSDPCDRTPSSVDCVRLAASALGTNGVLVTWSIHGFPGWSFAPGQGSPLTVGQHQASMAAGAPTESCQGIGGVKEIIVTIPRSAPWNWAELHACLAGPDPSLAQAQVEAMLKSVVWKQW